jgi:putative GTP pyrophosphokinase
MSQLPNPQRKRRRRGVPAMLVEYDRCVGLYAQFGPKAETLIRDVLAAHQLRPHSVTHRVKERLSMERKLNRPDKHYPMLTEVTDLLGVRVITHFPDDVDNFASVLLPEFELLETVDRRETDDPRQFGYASLHCVVRLDPARRSQLEYQRFADCVLELQIRSILQHAWAEIEHDLGYKTSRAIPRELRRRFSRLSGLLELADDEFRAIRDASKAYAQRVEQGVGGTPSETALDQDSIAHFIRTNHRIRELDESLADTLKMPIDEGEDHYAGSLSESAAAAGFRTIGEIEAQLESHSDTLRKFSSDWLAEDDAEEALDEIPRGISLFHLFYLVSAERGDDQLRTYIHAAGFSDPDEWAEEVREAIGRILGR